MYCIITNAANSCMNQTGQKYLTIVMTGLSQTEAARADSTLDDGNVTTGMFQWVAKGAGVADTTRFYALPIQ